MTFYKDRKSLEVSATKVFERDHVRESRVNIGSHCGTHIDAPSHFLEAGASIDRLELDKVVGPCHVIDCTQVTEKITQRDLEGYQFDETSIVLCKTRNSAHEPSAAFLSNFIYLDQSAARFLAARKIKAVGIDYLGIERNQPNHETHTILFEAGVVIVEGLRLAQVAAGNYFFIALPLAYQGLEAAPARAILIEDFAHTR